MYDAAGDTWLAVTSSPMAIKVHFMISLLSWHAQQVGATGLWEMCETAQRSPSLPFRESFSGQSRRAANPARARRWGDRIARFFAAAREDAIGTSRTSGDVRLESAKWGKADIDPSALIGRVWNLGPIFGLLELGSWFLVSLEIQGRRNTETRPSRPPPFPGRRVHRIRFPPSNSAAAPICDQTLTKREQTQTAASRPSARRDTCVASRAGFSGFLTLQSRFLIQIFDTLTAPPKLGDAQ
jgi:hypothetical protein